MAERKRIKVLLAKVGLDGHDRGVLVVSLALRDAGMEVIYTGRHATPAMVAETASQEDVDIVGISALVDSHRTVLPKVIKALKDRGRGDIPVILGGFIQPEDIPELKQQGVAEVFGLDSKLGDIVAGIKQLVEK
ncbi:MAG: cobalamin B12-binding domain-containing protein [Chloroflexi bacterium]|nr:cobalamin B12-binding domain-containing protein [Chloroflexota bacterium]